jgi:N6-L-threonylcarbamoyladenine synthase
MRVLGIETTCDETAVAIVERDADGLGLVLADEVLSQIAQHAAYGGVVPEIAARAHADTLDLMIDRALKNARLTLDDMDGIAASAGPGLVGGLIVGLTSAKMLALIAQKPLIGVNHLEAHALTARLTDRLTFPYLLLLVSGGHTQLLAVKGVGEYVRLGTTLDDAVGEAFDKAAKMLGLPYPGGPHVEEQALKGDPERFALPRPMLGRANPDFSFSGLKTALRVEAEKMVPLNAATVADLCASLQAAIVDVLEDRTRAALRAFVPVAGAPTALVVAGGVAANQTIRRALQRLAMEVGLKFIAPPLELCADNGVMVAWAGVERLSLGLIDDLSIPVRPRWPLEEISAPFAASSRYRSGVS